MRLQKCYVRVYCSFCFLGYLLWSWSMCLCTYWLKINDDITLQTLAFLFFRFNPKINAIFGNQNSVCFLVPFCWVCKWKSAHYTGNTIPNFHYSGLCLFLNIACIWRVLEIGVVVFLLRFSNLIFTASNSILHFYLSSNSIKHCIWYIVVSSLWAVVAFFLLYMSKQIHRIFKQLLCIIATLLFMI